MEIRTALWHNLEDPDDEVRGEALLGLAERRDVCLIDHLMDRLDTDCRVHELDAAEKLADPRLLFKLRALEAAVPEHVDPHWLSPSAVGDRCLQRK